MVFYDTEDFFEKALKENERKRQKKQEKQERLAQKKLLIETIQKAGNALETLPHGSLEWAYQVLQVCSQDSLEVVKKNYLILAQKYHPDRNPHADSQAMTDLNYAWEIIRQRV